MIKQLLISLSVAALSAAPANATVTINFSDQAASFTVPVSNPLVYADATFSSPGGLRVFTFSGLIDKGLCPHATNACLAPLSIAFTKPVSNISFGVFQVDTTRLLTVSGTTTSGTFKRELTLAPGFATNVVSLTGLTDVTSLVLDGTTDEEGYLYDNFQFDPLGVVSAPAVAEPATWLMMILGFGITGFGMRRRFKTAMTHPVIA